jgi:hypothetical protein
MVAGSGWTALQSWTFTSAINQGNAWNTLRVVANGAILYLYFNGTLVWAGSDSSLSSGRAGIEIYSDGTVGDQLSVDWARLTLLSSAFMATDRVSAEQQALNDAANRQRVGDRRFAPSTTSTPSLTLTLPATGTPLPTETPTATYTPIPTPLPTDTPVPTPVPTDTPVPSDTLPPTAMPL